MQHYLAGLVLILFFYALPMYIANSCAMIFGGGKRIDFGFNFFDGKPILGKGKTIKGTIMGMFCGTLFGFVVFALFPGAVLFLDNYLWFSFFASIGAIVGDFGGSFFKRRMGLGSGKEWLFLDQLDFIFGGIVFAFPIYALGLDVFAVLVVVTLVLHKASNYIAFQMRMKSVPW